ncbi:MAG: YgiQ family radical SAM protein [Candidatus Wallbacteria bacterium HGW-Wallbacteria-1]|jgi:uncharacterized radical SAM protein YgiQ|uniref:YgiQ family radical SAM protein n=1 Tax=Candidatus Wallbacteria bacterium HGW-Wallbacteria-1 TaxID=2013854 RepID=A0A2N1PS53_9BACT|nr:MAG: YgiQ family radical SAM protein [Candidatus Wallbacteria bacterium HGW-Wallbacteria-1]
MIESRVLKSQMPALVSPCDGIFRPVFHENASAGSDMMDVSAETPLPVLDAILVTGDAYVDHPAWGVAVIARILMDRGLRVGIIAQPRVDHPEDMLLLGRPRLFFGVTSGNMDSMIANRTSLGFPRSRDPYSPGGQAGRRPDRALIPYCNALRKCWPSVPLILGGIESSLRRFSHFDWWEGKLRRSIIHDSGAWSGVYGMGERAILEIVDKLAGKNLKVGNGVLSNGEPLSDSKRDSESDGNSSSESIFPVLWGIRGTVISVSTFEKAVELLEKSLMQWELLPDFDSIRSDPEQLMKLRLSVDNSMLSGESRALVQRQGKRGVIVQFPPQAVVDGPQLDSVHELPFTRELHPAYGGTVEALETVRDSVISHRGCFGGCSFCALTAHQGREIGRRSVDSLIREIEKMSSRPGFRGTIRDVGGPSANMYTSRCLRPEGLCTRKMCLFPQPCKYLDPGTDQWIRMLDRLGSIRGVKHLFVGSGIRFDLIMADSSPEQALRRLMHHISGQMKIAPEHISGRVLRLMGKTGGSTLERFLELFAILAGPAGTRGRRFVIPYLMSGHPGCTMDDMRELALFVRKWWGKVEQVQEFIPTPGSLSTAMYYSGIAPDGSKIPVARSQKDRIAQRRVLQPWYRRDREEAGGSASRSGKEHPVNSRGTSGSSGTGRSGKPVKRGRRSGPGEKR